MQSILVTPKGERPAPETYLSKKYIKNHLKKFRKSLSIVTSVASFEKYMLHADLIGREDNTCFVMPKKFCDAIEKEAGANEYWIPGGYTVGDTPEAVTDRIPKARIIVRFLPATKK